MADEPIAAKERLFRVGGPLSPPHSWGPPKPNSVKFCYKILKTIRYHMVKTRSLYLTWSWNNTGA